MKWYVSLLDNSDQEDFLIVYTQITPGLTFPYFYRMNELGIDPSGNLMFAQLLGMRDHITLSLGI